MLKSFLHGSLFAGIALAAAAPVAPALADVKAGVDAWSRGDYAAAIREWKGPAEQGDADAQFNLGQAYKLGRGVPRDLAKAEAFFAKASASGHLQASDNYGLLLFQRGERARAMPYITAAADRGDARAQYLLGLAYFNGENVVKDWVRAYALVSLAQQSGLPQAVPALAQMDQHIPLAQRQQAVKLSRVLAADADATRARQLAAIDLGAALPGTPRNPPPTPASPSMSTRAPSVAPPQPKSPSGAGADYTRPKPPSPKIPAVADLLETASDSPIRTPPSPVKSAPARTAAVKPAKPSPAPRPAPAPPSGPWRVQLGAFGVPGNAEALWSRVRNRPELAGHGRLLVSAGRLTKLQAGGFASSAEAQAACRRLSAAGFACIPARN